jgi:Tfp pilus assembly protein PilX
MNYSKQRGSGMLAALILILSLTFLGVAATRTSVMELRMARNLEEEMNIFQTAQAAVDSVISDTANLPVSGPLFTPTTVTLSGTPFDTVTGEVLTAQAERTVDCGPPPRIAKGASLRSFSSFSYRISADVDKLATGKGRSYVRQGYLVLGPKC